MLTGGTQTCIGSGAHRPRAVSVYSAAKALDEIATLAFAVVQDFLDRNGSVLLTQDIPRPILAAVKKLEADEVCSAAGEDRGRTVVGRRTGRERSNRHASG